MCLFVIVAVACVTISRGNLSAETSIRCATTTSLQNSGLLDHILPLFTKKTGIRVDAIAVGTGAAIEIGKRGDADFVFVHARELELKAVQEGYFINRMEFMYNDFIVVGPPNDPAKIKGIKKASEGFDKISKSGSVFISRGDNSGTHVKELSIWKDSGINPKGQPWYLESGQGMSKTLRLASEKSAYTLTDRSTWLADKDKPELTLLLEGDTTLINYYSVMAVNPQKNPSAKYKEAMEFINWVTSKEGTDAIREFKDKAGNQLFYIIEKH
ncbi:MAG: substrate-binding domain-containing protein [Nitrospirae bacterium]|nr:substrate-binding domain-containing protein [Nitrospirota bacterium]MBF0536423.1 substrate-binding domain-containing protein [Nitrospirota bacterium]MBF0618366.1 substrate-binding domain-containing protein [Nitrospirota bacterium]